MQDFDYTERLFPSCLQHGIGYAAGFYKGSAWVGLRIRMDDRSHTKRVFDELSADRASIESELADVPDAQWSWHRHDHFTYSSINLSRNGAIHYSPDRLAETRAWMLDMLPRLRAVLDPRLAAILDDLRSRDST